MKVFLPQAENITKYCHEHSLFCRREGAKDGEKMEKNLAPETTSDYLENKPSTICFALTIPKISLAGKAIWLSFT